MTRMRGIPLVGLLVVGLTAGLSAHMKLEKAEPAPDSTVSAPLRTIQVWFSEVPDPAVSKIVLTGPSGAVKLMGLHAMDKSLMVSIEGTAPAGAYTVAWQSAGADGHAQKGEFTFTLTSGK